MKLDVVAHIYDPTSLRAREELETKEPPEVYVYGKVEGEHHPLRFPSTYVLRQACIAFTHDHA